MGTFAEHALWQAIGDAADELEGREWGSESTTDVCRVQAVLAYAAASKDGFHEALVSPARLDQAQSHVTSIASNLRAGNLAAASQHADALLTAVAGWGLPSKGAMRADQARAAFAELTKSQARQLEQLAQRREQLSLEVGQLEAEVRALSARAEKIRQDVESVVEAAQARFDEVEDERATEFASHLAKADGRLEEHFDQARATSAKGLKQLDEVQEEAADRLAKINDLSARIAGAILGNDFGKYAARERTLGVVFYIAATVAVGVAVHLVSSGIAAIQPDSVVSWPWVALKLSLSALLGGGAAVLFQRGAALFASSHVMKQKDLELKAISPLLAEIDEEERARTIVRFVDRTFGIVATEAKAKRSAEAEADGVETISASRAFGLVEDLAKKVPGGTISS